MCPPATATCSLLGYTNNMVSLPFLFLLSSLLFLPLFARSLYPPLLSLLASLNLPQSNHPGPVVRYGPNDLSFNSASALKTIYSHAAAAHISKAPFYTPFASSGLSIQNVRDKAIHARKKKVMSVAFSAAALREMEAYIVDKVDDFCALMGPDAPSQWSEPRDMNHWFGYLTMDILGEMCYGKSFGMLHSEENRWVVHLLSNAAKFTLFVRLSLFSLS